MYYFIVIDPPEGVIISNFSGAKLSDAIQLMLNETAIQITQKGVGKLLKNLNLKKAKGSDVLSP